MTPEQLRELFNAVRKKMRERTDYVAKYGHARTPQMVGPDGQKFLVVGSRIYRQDQAGKYDLLNLFHDCALEQFGSARLDAEESKPAEQMHPAVRWMHSLVKASEEVRNGGAHVPTGWSAAWIRFGYDLFTVRDNAELMRKLSKELLDPGEFQSARFELKVAAIALSAGFTTAFEDERQNTTRHPEFIAIDQRGDGRIAVEAKSRRRHGVLGFRGGHPQEPGASVGVRSLLVDAFGKASELPFYVCVDLNLPPSTRERRDAWIDEIHQTVRDLDAEGYLANEAIHGILFMNDPSHQIGERGLGGFDDSLWLLPFKFREYACEGIEEDVLDRLVEAHHQRVTPPSDVPS